ncbi:MAG: energy transducer TonB [Gammaproteobacteria bacterium]|nr:energy transducer TonB [Gammaproteobacteria bacterium]
MSTRSPLHNPVITATDRLGLTLFLALAIHAIVILGVTFTPQLLHNNDAAPTPIEITLVTQRSAQAPEKADLLAQSNLLGGGQTSQPQRPRAPATRIVGLSQSGHDETLSLPGAPASPQQPPPRMTRAESDYAVADRRSQPLPPLPVPSAAELARLSMEIADLSAELDQSLQSLSKQRHHRYISAQTREYRDAAYLDAWRSKVERIGNLNYPEEARRRGLSGSLILDVALNPDGSVLAITVQRSSGQKLLDDAAKRIVLLAAPYAPFPETMRKDTDVLHIIRSWQFLNDNTLSTGR